MQNSACQPRGIDPLLTEHWPHRARIVLRNTLSIVLLVQTLTGLDGLDTRTLLGTLGLLVVAVGGAVTFTHRRQGDLVDHIAMILVIAAGAGLHVFTGHGQVFIAGYSAVFVSMYWYGLPWGLVPAGLGVVAVGLATAYVGRHDPIGGLGQAAGAVGLGAAMAYRRRVLRENYRNRELSHELRDSREAEQRNALAAERARLARELHDVLAHTLSSLSLHLESTRMLALSRNVESEVMERIDRAVSLARTGLEEARSAVGTLRDDALPGPTRLPQLVDDFGRDSGVAASFVETGTPQPLGPEARVALFRAAQEALTNVAKHAAARTVTVTVEWLDAEVVLRVDDDGRGSAGPASDGGNGLRGMRERAELAGGRLTAGPGVAGYRVELRLPITTVDT
jgi:signal transduction histidine kinase